MYGSPESMWDEEPVPGSLLHHLRTRLPHRDKTITMYSLLLLRTNRQWQDEQQDAMCFTDDRDLYIRTNAFLLCDIIVIMEGNTSTFLLSLSNTMI